MAFAILGSDLLAARRQHRPGRRDCANWVAAGLVHWSPGLIAILAYNCVVTTALGYFLSGKVLSMCRQRGMAEWLARRDGGVKIQVHLLDQSHGQRRDAMTPITASSHLAPAGEPRFRRRIAVALPPRRHGRRRRSCQNHHVDSRRDDKLPTAIVDSPPPTPARASPAHAAAPINSP
jgi:hypothetical protein